MAKISAQTYSGIPPAAEFKSETREWFLESFDDDGNLHGICRFWRTSGSLVEEQKFEHGRYVYIRRFHPNGELAFERSFCPTTFLPLKNTMIATQVETDIPFPRGGLDPRIVKIEYIYNSHGYTVEWIGWDADNVEILRENVDRTLDSRVVQKAFSSLEEASAEWNQKGDDFFRRMNGFIEREIFSGREGAEVFPIEPMVDERAHMERLVLETIERLNKEGQPQLARKIFKPAFEPFCKTLWSELGQGVEKLCALDGEAIVSVGDSVYSMTGDCIEQIPEMIKFGVSRNKKFFARCYQDRIEISAGMNGEIRHRLPYPKDYGREISSSFSSVKMISLKSPQDMGIRDVLVSNRGDFVILVSHAGIFSVDQDHARLFFPSTEILRTLISEAGSDKFRTHVIDPCAELSLDDSFLVMSGKVGDFSPSRWTRRLDQEGASEKGPDDSTENYFTPTWFHSKNSRHLVGFFIPPWDSDNGDSTYIATMEESYVRSDAKALLPRYQGVFSIRRDRLLSVAEFDNDFLIGMSNGFLWHQGVDDIIQKYVAAGFSSSTGGVTSIDVTPDRTRIFLGTDYGAIWCLRVSEQRSENLVTNMNLQDERRYLFLKTFDPMIW